MKFTRVGDDTVRMRLAVAEADTLAALLTDLVDTLQPSGLDRADPVYRRLYPDGYQENAEAADAFRSLTESSLQQERLGRAEDCRAGLAALDRTKRRMDLSLDPEAAQCWLQVLNDMRLAIGTRIGVTEDEPREFHADDQDAMPRAVYGYLSGMQDALVQACMG
ncbi:MAG: DUF2017 family protein [Jatrophihabitantaceae bacterium]